MYRKGTLLGAGGSARVGGPPGSVISSIRPLSALPCAPLTGSVRSGQGILSRVTPFLCAQDSFWNMPRPPFSSLPPRLGWGEACRAGRGQFCRAELLGRTRANLAAGRCPRWLLSLRPSQGVISPAQRAPGTLGSISRFRKKLAALLPRRPARPRLTRCHSGPQYLAPAGPGSRAEAGDGVGRPSGDRHRAAAPSPQTSSSSHPARGP